MPVASRFLFCACLILLWWPPNVTVAQAPAEQDTSQLPDIAPQEIEIRGELQIDFPALVRQPLQGFEATQPLPSVPVDRLPYVEPYKQELDALPGQLPAPAPVSQSTQRPPPPRTGTLEFGSGRYFSRFVEGHVSAPLSSNETLSFQLDYHGTEGETPFENLDTESSSDEAVGTIRLTSRRDPVHVQAAIDGTVDDYALFGVPRGTGLSTTSAPDRTLTSGGVSVDMETVGSVSSHVGFSFHRTQYETTFSSTPDLTFRENRIAFDGSIELPFGPVPGRLEAALSHSRLREDVPDDAQSDLDVGGIVTVIDRPDLMVKGGLRVLWAEGPNDPARADSRTESPSYVAPVLNVEWHLTPWATVVARNRPHLDGASLRALHAQNPFVEAAPTTRPTLYAADSETGLNLTAGRFRFETRAGFRYAPSYRYFQTPTAATQPQGLFSVRHDEARIFHGGARIALQGVDGVQASLGVSVRDGEFTDSDTDIPHFATVTADAMAAVSFADDKGYFQLTGTLDGPRDRTTVREDEIDTFLALDITGSYSITSLVDIVVRANNIGSGTLERWPEFPRPSNSVSAGFQIRW